MTRFDDYLEEQLKDPAIRAEWDALQPERVKAQAEINARREALCNPPTCPAKR